MQFNTSTDDSDLERINWLKEKLEKEWCKVDEYKHEDEEGNQLLITYSLGRIEIITDLLNHYIYN